MDRKITWKKVSEALDENQDSYEVNEMLFAMLHGWDWPLYGAYLALTLNKLAWIANLILNNRAWIVSCVCLGYWILRGAFHILTFNNLTWIAS